MGIINFYVDKDILYGLQEEYCGEMENELSENEKDDIIRKFKTATLK
jgi:hypothetical protein